MLEGVRKKGRPGPAVLGFGPDSFKKTRDRPVEWQKLGPTGWVRVVPVNPLPKGQ